MGPCLDFTGMFYVLLNMKNCVCVVNMGKYNVFLGLLLVQLQRPENQDATSDE